MSEPKNNPMLQVSHLAKRFEGIVATDDIVLDVAAGELHAVIGPNGAGKTTLIAQLSGQLTPDSGRIHFAGNDITQLPMYRRSALGLARSFQITSLFLDLSVLDNVALAVQAQAGHSFHFWRNARAEPELCEPGRALLARVGLSDRADWPASVLSHGEHRQLELAMALAGSPRMLLLDEPMAGPGRARHGSGVRARRPHHGAGLWPGDRLRRARRHPRQRRRARCLSGRGRGGGRRPWLITCSTSPESKRVTA